MSDPDYRYCIYCKCDCDDFPGAKPDHASDCPDVTGLFPVSVRDIREHLECLDCGQRFKPGDYYVQVREHADIADIVCLSCGMLEAIANGS